jgi:hypothetical protein
VAANSAVERDPRAGDGSLKRPENKLAVFSDVKADPEKSESFLYNRRNVPEVCDRVGFARDKRVYLPRDLRIDLLARG